MSTTIIYFGNQIVRAPIICTDRRPHCAVHICTDRRPHCADPIRTHPTRTPSSIFDRPFCWENLEGNVDGIGSVDVVVDVVSVDVRVDVYRTSEFVGPPSVPAAK